ncbi:MAG: hypothetical protein ACKOFW_18260, partial [Planctomycetaceae bacterium]
MHDPLRAIRAASLAFRRTASAQGVFDVGAGEIRRGAVVEPFDVRAGDRGTVPSSQSAGMTRRGFAAGCAGRAG